MSLSERIDQTLHAQFAESTSSVYRDLSLNFKKILEESPLDETDRLLNVMAIATALEDSEMMAFATQELQQKDLSREAIQEARESAAIMGMLNTYYKFKGYLSTETAENYQRAGLRMQSLAKPLNGKEKFEQMAFSVSVVNGCPSCIASHEKALSQLGLGADKIHDLARLAAVMKGLHVFKKTLV